MGRASGRRSLRALQGQEGTAVSYKHPRLSAFKPCTDKPGYLVVCDADDAEATEFQVKYPNSYGLSLSFESGYKAYQVARALEDAISYGRDAQMADVRRFLGIK
jgi:hypothetical protein